MVDIDYSNYDAAYRESQERYIEENYPTCIEFKDYNSSPQGAHTLDEYLVYLIKGYINVEIKEALEKHLMELLEDEWFYQWPLVHWAYASRLLYGVGTRKRVKPAVELLLPMAESECPCAMYDIGYCYINGLTVEQSYGKAMYYFTKASSKGYLPAQRELRSQYLRNDYKNLPIELKYDFLCEVKNLFVNARGGYDSFKYDSLDEEDKKKYKKLCREAERLEKPVKEKIRLRESASLFWNDEENPYKTNF